MTDYISTDALRCVCNNFRGAVDMVITRATKGEIPGIPAFELHYVYSEELKDNVEKMPKEYTLELFKRGHLTLEDTQQSELIAKVVDGFLKYYNLTRADLEA